MGPSTGQGARRSRGRRLLSAGRSADVVVPAVVAAAAAAVLVAASVTGSGWPAVLLVVAAALPAVVPVGRAVAVGVVLLAVGCAAASLLVTASGREATTWVLAATALAAALGAYGWRRYAGLAAGLAQARARQEALAVHDDLTGCVNHAGLQLFGDHLLQGVRRAGESMHALVVDVDALGGVEVALGRRAADEVLVAVADALMASTRGTDVVARWPRDDFAVLGAGPGVSAGELERRIRARLVEAPPAPAEVWPCRVTAGLAVLEPWDGGDVSDLLRKAHEDLSLRSSLRAPSAPEPGTRQRP